MSTLREAAIGAMGALETARNGLAWYRDRYPESTDGSDDEAAGDIDAAIDALRAELVKPDAPTVEDEPAPQMPEALRDSLQRRCVEWGVYWRAPDAHGVDLTHEQALELLRDALGVEVEIAAAPRPAPAEPQPIAAWSIVRTAESAVVTAVRAALSAAPAPQPAGGERERYEFVLAQCREAQDIAASRGWALNDIATASTTDPRARKIATEALLSTSSQLAAQPEPVAFRCWHPKAERCYYVSTSPPEPFRSDTGEPNEYFGGKVEPLYTQAEERKPLTDEQINDFVRRVTGIAGGRSLIGEQVTAFARIVEAAHGITATKGDNHA